MQETPDLTNLRADIEDTLNAFYVAFMSELRKRGLPACAVVSQWGFSCIPGYGGQEFKLHACMPQARFYSMPPPCRVPQVDDMSATNVAHTAGAVVAALVDTLPSQWRALMWWSWEPPRQGRHCLSGRL